MDEPNSTLIPVRVTPSAKKNLLHGLIGREWQVKISAPPTKGKANEALLEYLCSILGKQKNELSLIKGIKSRHKLIRVSGVSAAEIETQLAALASTKHP
ncbi:MAG: DUF167 domain-containing protein [Dehalococcoidia bacterium]|nr:DUF167 domain-containing protein [Dehalococcoidia bacterium]